MAMAKWLYGHYDVGGPESHDHHWTAMGKLHAKKLKPKVLPVEFVEGTDRRGKRCYIERALSPSPAAGPSMPRRSQGQTTSSKRAQLEEPCEQDLENSEGTIHHRIPRKTKVRPFSGSAQSTAADQSIGMPDTKFIPLGVVALAAHISQ